MKNYSVLNTRMFLKIIVCLSFIAFLTDFGAGLEVYKIGALFHEDTPPDARLALRYAVAWKNLYSPHVQIKIKNIFVPKVDTYKTNKLLCELLESGNGMVAIFGPKSSRTSSIVQSVCAKYEIPYMDIYWKPMAVYSPTTTLNFYPELEKLAQGIATIVRNMNWKAFTILYENTDALVKLKGVLEISTSTPIILKQLGQGTDHRLLLKEIKNSTITHILLDCETDRIMDVLDQAKDIQMLTMVHNYFLTSLDAHTLDFGHLNTEANITTIRIVDPEDDTLKRVVRNWEAGLQRDTSTERTDLYFSPETVSVEAALMNDAVTHFIDRVLELRETVNITSRPISCSKTEKWEAGYQITEYLKLRPHSKPTTGPMSFDEEGKRTSFNLQFVEINQKRKIVTVQWSTQEENQLQYFKNDTEREKQILEHLSKTTVIVTSKLGPPYLMNRTAEPNEVLTGNARYEGYSMDVIDALAKLNNFTYRFMLNADNTNGVLDKKTKKWNGLIADLLDGRAHLAICDLTITHERREAVDFTIPYMLLGISILHKKPTAGDRNIFAFMAPLSLEVWLYTATAYLGVSVMLYFIARMAPGDWENPHPCDDNPEELENIWDLKNCMWLTLGSIMTQGCDILPKGISTRMAASMWWFFSLIITSSYTANLAAFLTMERMDAGIDSVEDLAKQTKIKYGLMAGGATQTFFKESNFSLYQRMWTQMQQFDPNVFEKTNEEGVKRVQLAKKHDYAFFMESSTIEYIVAKECDLKKVGSPLDSKGYGIAMPMNAPIRSIINKSILKLQEDGTLSTLKTKWWKDQVKEQCDAEEVSAGSSSELALANVGGVFVVLGVGVFIAFLIAIGEFLWNVQNVSVEEHITYWEALKLEMKFAVNVCITKKSVKPRMSESSSGKSRGGSEEQNVLRGASSFLNMENLFDKLSMHNKT